MEENLDTEEDSIESTHIPNYILFYLTNFSRVRYTTRDLFPEYLGMARSKFGVYLRSLCHPILSEDTLWEELSSFSIVALNMETHNWVVVEPEFSREMFEKKALDKRMAISLKGVMEQKKIQETRKETVGGKGSDQKTLSNYEVTTNLQRGKLASLKNVIKNVKRNFYKKF